MKNEKRRERRVKKDREGGERANLLRRPVSFQPRISPSVSRQVAGTWSWLDSHRYSCVPGEPRRHTTLLHLLHENKRPHVHAVDGSVDNVRLVVRCLVDRLVMCDMYSACVCVSFGANLHDDTHNSPTVVRAIVRECLV